MNVSVSKERARKAKSRGKTANRQGGRVPLSQRPGWRLGIAVLLWLSTVMILRFENIVTGRLGLPVLFPLAGQAAFLLVALFGIGLFLKIVRPDFLRTNSVVGLFALMAMAAIIPGKLLMTIEESAALFSPALVGFLLPFALAPLLGTLLLGGVAGIAVGAWTAVALSMLSPDPFPLLITGFAATFVAAYTVAYVRTRAKVVRTGLVVGLVEILCVFGLTGLNWQHTEVALVVRQAVACLLSGFVCALLTLLILPLFETLFGTTTDITLLELSDLGHPLLQRLAIEAPGTYHHSLVVANLAQAAADEIGANSLLARVCCYFHDIGKLTKPEFFTENIQHRDNPHDALPPSMSTLVITAHVKEGVSLARVYKLPPPVLQVIQEHHGTGVLSYFHHKAKTQRAEAAAENGTAPGNGNGPVHDGEFRYEGPRPSTRESAIIALADSVEAASRSMDKPSPGQIEGMVEDVINTKLLDGQLSECELTLAELTRVRHSLIVTLTNMLHGRVPYPKDEHRDQQPAKQPAPRPNGAAGADPGVPGA
jgi:cyclic-di-AMP phosphodiesterase PgpH